MIHPAQRERILTILEQYRDAEQASRKAFNNRTPIGIGLAVAGILFLSSLSKAVSKDLGAVALIGLVVAGFLWYSNNANWNAAFERKQRIRDEFSRMGLDLDFSGRLTFNGEYFDPQEEKSYKGS